MASHSFQFNPGHIHLVGGSVGLGWTPKHALPRVPLLIQALVTRESRTDDGFLICAVEPAWTQIADLVALNPNALHQLTPEQMEELVAVSYDKAGFDEVVLTPRSGDLGRDVIAIRRGWGSVRIIDQVKRFAPGHVVTANDVRALLGVLLSDQAATKGIVTTTSEFAPRIAEDRFIKPHIPFRLELVDKACLASRLATLRDNEER